MIHKQQLSPFKLNTEVKNKINSLKAAWGDKKGPLYTRAEPLMLRLKKKKKKTLWQEGHFCNRKQVSLTYKFYVN